MSALPETEESLRHKQRFLNWEYITLLRDSQARPKQADTEARLACLRDEISVVDKALKNFKG